MSWIWRPYWAGGEFPKLRRQCLVPILTSVRRLGPISGSADGSESAAEMILTGEINMLKLHALPCSKIGSATLQPAKVGCKQCLCKVNMKLCKNNLGYIASQRAKLGAHNSSMLYHVSSSSFSETCSIFWKQFLNINFWNYHVSKFLKKAIWHMCLNFLARRVILQCWWKSTVFIGFHQLETSYFARFSKRNWWTWHQLLYLVFTTYCCRHYRLLGVHHLLQLKASFLDKHLIKHWYIENGGLMNNQLTTEV